MFWQNYFPAAILISIGSINIYFYGLVIVLAMLIATWYLKNNLLKNNVINLKQFEDLIFYTILFGLIGARLGHVLFFNFLYYWNFPADIIKVWQGGMSIQGALLFGLVTIFVFARRYKINFWKMTDYLVPAVALGQSIGRWGNYFNQELFGKPISWGIPIAPINRVVAYKEFIYFHPTFLYESILNLGLFFILHCLLKKKIKTGLLTLLYFGLYSIIRFLMEFVRIDETVVAFGLRLPQLISIGVIVIVCIIAYLRYLKPLPKDIK